MRKHPFVSLRRRCVTARPKMHLNSSNTCNATGVVSVCIYLGASCSLQPVNTLVLSAKWFVFACDVKAHQHNDSVFKVLQCIVVAATADNLQWPTLSRGDFPDTALCCPLLLLLLVILEQRLRLVESP
eukprot:1780716-Pleurochrysis_carterae.AAC.1